jgi:hypothetical protein
MDGSSGIAAQFCFAVLQDAIRSLRSLPQRFVASLYCASVIRFVSNRNLSVNAERSYIEPLTRRSIQ